jgi:hypothetical protein
MNTETAPVSRDRFAGLVSRDGLSGLLLIGFAAATLIINGSLAFGTPGAMGPGFFPRILAVALILTGLWILIRGIVRAERDVSLATLRQAPWRGLIVVSICILLFAAIIDSLGLFAASAVLLFGSGFASARLRLVESAIFSILMTVAVVAIFVWGLKVPIPLWPRL